MSMLDEIRHKLDDEMGLLDHELTRILPERIRKAVELGDLRENAEYHAAREQQGFIEGRVQLLESTISHAQIIDIERLNPGDKVVFGATVRLADEETGEEKTYQIVGDVEADIKHHRIAVSSPISRALIGQEVGDVVVVRAPAGDREFEIIDVEYM